MRGSAVSPVPFGAVTLGVDDFGPASFAIAPRFVRTPSTCTRSSASRWTATFRAPSATPPTEIRAPSSSIAAGPQRKPRTLASSRSPSVSTSSRNSVDTLHPLFAPGSIEVESAAGQGSRFFFSLPLPVVAVPGEAGAQTVAEASLGPARVLVVEDNPVNQRVAVALLKKLGIQVEVANDGAEALERLARDRGFHLVLMDCQMPVLDGISATRRLRALEPADAPRLPVVALTANTLPEDRAACADAGMDDFLEKPVNAAKLRAVLARLLPRRAA